MSNSTFEQVVSAIDVSLDRRLDALESRVSVLENVWTLLEGKLNKMSETILRQANEVSSIDMDDFPAKELNSKDDYPDGTWLGDENNPQMRVRCSIAPAELFRIESTCGSATKMAVVLMDFLFDRKTMACSCLAGGGPYNKCKLDPLKISAIKFHLRHKFHISNDDWRHIRNNIDSKCRTAFRRKLKGMPLGPYRNRFSVAPANSVEDDHAEETAIANPDDSDQDDILTGSVHSTLGHPEPEESASALTIKSSQSVVVAEGDKIEFTLTEAHVIETVDGPIRILHATAEIEGNILPL